jgi:predicted RecB family nuclease
MTYPITHVEGLDVDEIRSLRALGIRTTERLLEEAKSPKGRELLAAKTDISVKRLLMLANACDQLRISGMGKGYVPLLREAGVDTVRELRYRSPANLAKVMSEANRRKKLVRLLPSEKLIVRWIEHARKLPLKITYKNYKK